MDRRRKIPLLGVLSAVMLAAMSLEILPIAYHLNLSVVAGILLGPSLGFIAAFIVNCMLALLGHGGITVMGLNTLLLGAEAMLGHALFYLLPDHWSVSRRAASATVLALLLASCCLIAIVGISHADSDRFLPRHGGEADHQDDRGSSPALGAFAVTVLSVGLIGWIIEAAVTGAVIRFLSQVKPELLSHVLHKDTCKAGTEGCTP